MNLKNIFMNVLYLIGIIGLFPLYLSIIIKEKIELFKRKNK